MCCGMAVADGTGPCLLLRNPRPEDGWALDRLDVGDLEAGAVEEWFQVLFAALLTKPAPRSAGRLKAGACLALSEQQAVASGDMFSWVTIREGSAYLLGRRSRQALMEQGHWPLPPHGWLISQRPASVSETSWELLRATERADKILVESTRLISGLLEQDASMRATIELKRLEARSREDRRLMEASCRDLASVLTPEGPAPTIGDPLEAVIRRVASDTGVPMDHSPRQTDERPVARLKAYARANRFRTRRVALREAWWSAECGSMLGAIRDAEDQVPRPIAIRRIPAGAVRRHRYVIWDPTNDRETPLTAQTAAALSPFAYAFYRPMPAEPVRLRTLARLGFDGSQRDGWRVVLLGILAGGLAAVTPVLTGKVYDVAIPEASRTQLIQIVALLLSLGIGAALLQFVRAVAVLRVETRLDNAIQSGIWDHLLRLPVQFFRRFTAGDLAVRAGGVGQIRQLMSSAITTTLLTGIFSAWYLALLYYYDLRMAAWVTVGLALFTLVSLTLSWLQLRHLRVATRVQARLSGQVLQFITGLSKLRVAGAEVRAFARWATRFAEQRRSYVAGRRFGNLLAAVQAAAPILILALVYRLVIVDDTPALSTGAFLAFQTALLSLASATIAITSTFAAASSAVPLFEQLRPILECEQESDVLRNDPGALTGDIEIRHVTFSYAPDVAPALDDVSLHVPSGAFVALVGPSGSGKSSLLRLLLGFEQSQSGSIYFDGQDIAGLDIHALRRQFGVVLQEAGVLAGDMFTNIAGSSDATLEDAWEAARLAGLADDIRAMPMGMHTVIDQSGSTISGGQRQRLMIARAIVHRPRILLFDEATSALDNVTQQHVSNSLNDLNVTRIVVAHRLSTVRDADQIYVFDRGCVVEVGTYDTLMRTGGLFYRLAQRQMT